MQFALESYLIPFDDIIVTEGLKENLSRMGRGFIKAVILIWTKLTGLITKFVNQFSKKQAVEFDDYVEDSEEYYEKADDTPTTVCQRNDKLIADIVSVTQTLSGNLTYICGLVYGPNSDEREMHVVNGMTHDVLDNNLSIFDNRAQELMDIPNEERVLSAGTQTKVCSELQKQSEQAESIRQKLNKYYNGMVPGESWVDNKMIKLMPTVNKSLTTYVNNVSIVINHLWKFTPVEK